MTLDRGGLQYPIEVQDQFSGALALFRAQVTTAREAMAAFKAEVAAFNKASTSVATGTKEIAKATSEASKGMAKQAQEAKKAAKSIGISEQAMRKYAKAVEAAGVSREFARISEERNFRLQKRGLSVQQARTKAEQDLTRILDKRLLREQRVAAFQERGIALSTDEMRQLKLLTKEQDRLAKASEKAARAIKDSADESLRAMRIASQVANIRSRNADIAARAKIFAADGLDANGRPIKTVVQTTPLTPEQVASKNAAKELDAVKQRSLRTAAIEAEAQKRGIKLTKEQRRELGLVGKEYEKTARSARTFSTGFSRIVSSLVAFAALRQFASTFREVVREIIDFNARVETAQLGIASLFTATADVRDALGQSVEASQALSIAQAEARRQTAALRKDALQTAATFDDLLFAFQTAIAPGFQAGLNTDEIRRFTVQISQAAVAIGLEQNQLAEEIRSLLQGTIQPRQTRIATALGITNEDIRRAKEAGVLFEFLQTKFTAFTVAGEESLKTYQALLTNLQDGFRLLFSAGGEAFFNDIKQGLKRLFDTITDIDPITGLLVPNPDAIRAVQGIASGLSRAVGEAEKLATAFGFSDLAQAGAAFGDAIATAAAVVRGIVQGIVLALSDISAVLESISGLSLFNNSDLGETVALIVRIVSLQYVISSVLGPIVSTTIAWGTALFAASTPTLIIAGVLAAIAAILVGINEATRLAIRDVDGLDLSSLQTAKLILSGIADTLDAVATAVSIAIVRLEQFGKVIASAFLNKLAKGVASVLSGVRSTLAALNDLSKRAGAGEIVSQQSLDILEQGTKELKEYADARERSANTASREANQQIRIIKAMREANKLKFERGRQNIIADDRGIAKRLQDYITSIRNAISPQLKRLFDDIAGGAVNTSKLSDVFRELPGIISRSSDAIDESSESVKKLRDQSIEASDALRESLNSIGLDGPALAIRSLLLRGEVDTREALKGLSQDEIRLTEEGNRLAIDRVKFESVYSKLSAEQQSLSEKGVGLAKQTLAIDRDIANAKSSVAIAEAVAQKARTTGIQSEIDAATESLSLENQKLAVLQAQAAEIDSLSNALLDGVDPAQSQAVVLAISRRIQLEGQETDLTNRLTAAARDRARAEALISDAVQKRIQAIATEAAFVDSRQTDILTVEAQNRRAEIAAATANSEARALVEAENELRVMQLRTEQARELRDLQIEDLSTTLDTLTSLEAIAAVELELSYLKQQNAILTELENDNLREQLRLREEARIKASGSLSEQINLSLEILDRELPSRFEAIIDVMASTISSFTDFITQSIVDAFDPNAKGDISERFGRFLQGIATQIISMLVQIAITKAALGVSGLFFAEGGQVPQSFKRGGTVRGRRRNAISRAEGGDVPRSASRPGLRPAGIPTSDTVPAWLTPGEFVQKLDAVRMYGLDVMEAINRGAIDPTALRSLAKDTAVRARRRSGRAVQSFRDGGMVQTPTAAPAAAAGPVPAYVVANERTMDTILSGGSASLHRWLQTNGYRPA